MKLEDLDKKLGHITKIALKLGCLIGIIIIILSIIATYVGFANA